METAFKKQGVGLPETFTPASLRGSGSSVRDDRKHRSCCSAWPLDESKNNERLSSGSPCRTSLSSMSQILCLKKGHRMALTANCGHLVRSPTRPPTTTTYASGSLALFSSRISGSSFRRPCLAEPRALPAAATFKVGS